MCGIAGLIRPHHQPVSETELKQMTDAIIHRGPDGEGHWIDSNIGIGHRRLSIIDLSDKAAQPMLSQTGRYVLSYNGEVYNFRELRDELRKKGHLFTSDTDSEVVLNALIEWGPRALDKFNGMFAFAFYDIHEKQLMLARDRYGIKPLYIAQQNGLFAFASEQKAITALSDFTPSLNQAGLFEYLTFQNFLTDQTLIRNITLFPAAHYQYIQVGENYTLSPRQQYWDYDFTSDLAYHDERECQEELERLFAQAVKRQLVSDVPVGSYLSGGVDSGSITAVAKRHFPQLHSFTCGFDTSQASAEELSFDESASARKMAELFGTQHHEYQLGPYDMESCLSKLAYHLEEPRVGQSYPNYYAAKLARQHCSVVLSGAGGDELFAGYPWRYYRTVHSQSFEDYIDNYYVFWQRLVDNKILRQMCQPMWSDVSDIWTRDIFKDVFRHYKKPRNTPEDYVNHSLYFEAKTFLHSLFIIEDKISMSQSLETRVPFMDNDLVDFAMRCPLHFKLRDLDTTVRVNENENTNKQKIYFQKTNDGKMILRKAMSSFVPDDISNAVKQGFSAPDNSWFKNQNASFVKDKILNPQHNIYHYLDYDIVKSQVMRHFEGQDNKRLFIWSMLNLITVGEENDIFG